MWDIDGSLNPMGINETTQTKYTERRKQGPDLILKRFVTYRLAAESGGKPVWCYWGREEGFSWVGSRPRNGAESLS